MAERRRGKGRGRTPGRGPERLIWHIGDHKTGSTAIQEALHAVAGPELTFVTHRFNHTWLAQRLHKGADNRKVMLGFARLERRLARAETPVAVVSAEEFEHVPPAVLRHAIERYLPAYADRVEVIAYVRPHLDAVRSRYCERVKLGTFFGGPARMALALRRQKVMPYAPRFSAWARVFPGAFTLRPMVREALEGRDVVTDFFAQTGLAALSPPRGMLVNPALSVEDLAAVQAAQRSLLRAGAAEGLRAGIGRALGRTLTDDPVPGHHPVRLSPALARWLARAWRADAAALDKAFFADDVMQRCLARAGAGPHGPAEPLARRHMPDALAAELADRAARLESLPRADRPAEVEALARDLAPQIRAMPVVTSRFWPGWPGKK